MVEEAVVVEALDEIGLELFNFLMIMKMMIRMMLMRVNVRRRGTATVVAVEQKQQRIMQLRLAPRIIVAAASCDGGLRRRRVSLLVGRRC